MIDGKRFKFGYGDVCVGATPSTRQIHFQQIKPPIEVGADAMKHNVEWIGERILIKVSYEDYQDLCKLLSRVKSREISEFTFKDYIFDFTNYNEKSVEVCKEKLSEAMSLYFLAMAC